MKALYLLVSLFLVSIVISGCGSSAVGRALKFSENAYNGIPMKESEWLVGEGRTRSSLLYKFGGLDALRLQSKAEADKNGGVSGVRVLRSLERNGKWFIEVEVIFKNGEKVTGADCWVLEDGVWKISPTEVQ